MASAEAPARNMRAPQTVRVAAVQYQLRAITSFEEFAQQIEYFVDVVADYKADFAVFPELFTLQLLSIEKRVPAGGGDRRADKLHLALQGNDEPTAGELQRQYHRRVASNA